MKPHRQLAILFCVCFFTLFSHAQTIVNGFGNISDSKTGETEPIYLYGSWEFYWNQLLEPATLKDSVSKAYIQVPGAWNRVGDYPELGYATYRAVIKMPEGKNRLSLYFPIFNSSAKIWVNGELMHKVGIASADVSKYKPKLGSSILSLPENVPQLDILIQVVNYSYFSGGMVSSPQLNSSDKILKMVSTANGVENFFAGSLIAMFIYQLILYFLYHRGKPYLWLSLICLGVAARAMIVHGGSFLLPDLFPAVGWEVWKKIEFGSVYLIVALFPLYVYHLFIKHAPKWPLYFFVTAAVFMCIAVVATPQYIYGELLEFCHACLLVCFIYAVYSITRAWREGNEDARIILFGVLASFPFIFAEIMKNSRIFPVYMPFSYLVEMGVLVFLIFQVFLLANHYAKSYRNLESLNQNLEKIVEERSGQLITANEVKDRLLSVMSHDIKSPLNSLRGVLDIYNKGAINQEEFHQLTKHIENDLSKTSLLVDNILYWTASQLRGIQVKNEEFALYQLMEENLQLFRAIVASKKISITHNAPKSLSVKFDRNILNLVLRNLLSNAIKFSHEDGRVEIIVNEAKDHLAIKVKDYGVGMDEKTLETLLAPELVMSTSGTRNEKGTGLGLTLCREYLHSAGGELTVDSEKGKGSIFCITIPL